MWRALQNGETLPNFSLKATTAHEQPAEEDDERAWSPEPDVPISQLIDGDNLIDFSDSASEDDLSALVTPDTSPDGSGLALAVVTLNMSQNSDIADVHSSPSVDIAVPKARSRRPAEEDVEF